MHTDLTHFRPLDPGRVNTMDPIELEYWCLELHCTPAQLVQAVLKAGEHVSAVREQLAALQQSRRA